MTGVAFTVGALSNVAFYNQTGQIALVAAGGNDSIIPAFIKTFLPEWFGGIFLVMLLAAAISTLNALCHTMGTALGRDFLKQSLKLKADTIPLTRVAMVIGLVISIVLTWLSSQLDMSMAIIAIGTSMFFGLCAATFLPLYIAALYIKKFPKAAAIASMVTGSATSLFWLFFVQEKTAGSLQICKLLFQTTSIVKDTALQTLSMVDAMVGGAAAFDPRGAAGMGDRGERQTRPTPLCPCAPESKAGYGIRCASSGHFRFVLIRRSFIN